MDHILARIRGVEMEDIKAMLKANASRYVDQGLVLRHIWRNVDNSGEILFIFTTSDLNRSRKFIERMHSEFRKENPNANLPEMIFLRSE
jgi:hypothetical protein